MLLGTLLSPVQAALLMLHAWPAHCDCFAFATAAIQQVCASHCSVSEFLKSTGKDGGHLHVRWLHMLMALHRTTLLSQCSGV